VRLAERKATAVKQQSLRFFYALALMALKLPEFAKSGAFSISNDGFRKHLGVVDRSHNAKVAGSECGRFTGVALRFKCQVPSPRLHVNWAIKSSATTGVKDEPISFDPQARRALGRVLLATLPLRAKRVCTCWQTTARFRAGRSSAPLTHPCAYRE
jgi:hypothetical protein